MEILAVALKNFKSHRDAYFKFQPGTNAICGENGAGKTSILEAIAWGLFNYKGAYKTEDLIRDRASSGQVRISFISSLDGRTYEVQRCTTKGYQVYDPQLKVSLELHRIEEDVLPWLRQHLGVPPGTDLARLFANTVGVPQGTFTADFLKPARERKATFDAMLKVEEYRQVYENFSALEKYAKTEVEKLEQAIAQYNDHLSDWEIFEAKQQQLGQEVATVQAALQQCQIQLDQLEQEKESLSAQAAQMQRLATRFDSLVSQICSQKQLSDRLARESQRAEQAVMVCTNNREGYHQFLNAETTLQVLERQRQQQQILLDRRQAYRDQLTEGTSQLATLNHQLKRFATIRGQGEQLTLLVEQQADLEQQQQAVVQALQECRQLRHTAQTEANRLQQIQVRLAKQAAEITAIIALERRVQQIPVLEEQQQYYQQQLSRVEAAQQFAVELQQIIAVGEEHREQHLKQVNQAQAAVAEIQQAMPLFGDVQPILTALHRGVELNQQLLKTLQTILQGCSQSSLQLAQQLQQVQQQLQAARQEQLQFSRLESLMAEQAELKQQAQELRAYLAHLQTRYVKEPELQRQQTQLTADLVALNNPRGLKRLYHQELQQQAAVEIQLQNTEQSWQASQQAIAELETQLGKFAELAEQVQTQQQQRADSQIAYLTYLEHQQLANSFKERLAEQTAAIAQLQILETESTNVALERDQLAQIFDAQRFEVVQSSYKVVETEKITLGARLPEISKRLEDVEIQLLSLKAIQQKCDRAVAERKQREKIKQFITFARKTYKQAGPRITERYVQNISREADKLFRELLNRQNVALEWTREYEIMVQEGAHSRRFINLSGGEQMCAALAVRLALLKVLADLDIAFFDEPTTNLDRPRREQLAEAIANIKTFRQLFVISHDDTFEKVTGNVVLVERQVE